MTPDTRPAPMTHEERLAALTMASGFLERSGREALAGLLHEIRAYIEAERTRAEALDDAVRLWRGAAHAKAAELEVAESRIAELEAVVGRCEALAEQWTYTGKATNADDTDTLLDQCADLLRTALRGQRSDTGRTEG